MAFTHLHLHTEYSLLDGACRIKDLMEELSLLGQKSVAITDHGVMYGAVDFYKAAKEKGIKPIIGCECYLASRGRRDKVHSFDSERFHLVLLCENEKGYENLIKMVSLSFTEGFYTKPRIDRDLLEKYHEGIIALSGCLSGEIPSLLLKGQFQKAKEKALWYRNIFGENNFFIEVQNHGLREELDIIPSLIKISRETGIPLVATNDCHYIKKTDSFTQKVLICIGTNKTLEEGSGIDFETEEFYLKSEEEMRALFSDIPEACDNTQIIAERCNFDFEFGNTKLPHFEVPNNMDHFEYFKNQCFFGLQKNLGENPPKEYIERLNYELEVINKMGYVDYFLIVHDFIRYAKSRKIPVGPGRGSGAGSLAAYCIGITGIDPLKYNLLFERFLNPERVSMPDFDIDFCYIRRPEVIDYVIGKYGSDHVAQIVTFGTMAAKGAVRDVGRVMGMSYSSVDEVAKLIPNELKITIDRALKISAELRNLYDNNENVKKLIDISRQVEGMPRHASTHAAGVVITRDPVASYVPLALNDESIVTQYTMVTLEQLGLLKMDFLGLRTLTVIDDAVKMIKRKEPNFEIDEIDLKDEKTFKMLSLGKTDGVFQYESSGMRSVLSRLKPESLEDLIAVISLYRPGPADSIDTYIHNRHNPKDTKYKSELLSDILDVTYGCMVYQEQVMEICRKLAGYSYGRADLVRRAMSKKKLDVMEKERKIFIYGLPEEGIIGAVNNGVDEKTANEIFDEMSNFAKYAFNKSHAAAYAYVSYQTAYLKAHYPCELMAATLTSVLDSASKVSEYIAECTRLGIKVLSPNVNSSFQNFTVSDNSIRFGLLAIKNLGKGFIKIIVDSREREGKFTTFESFCKRVHSKDFNKRAIESLIKAGACDGLGLNRRQMLYMLPLITAQIEEDKSRNISGQIGFFDENSGFSFSKENTAPNFEELSKSELLNFEKEVTGFYVSGHPMEEYLDVYDELSCDRISDVFSEGIFNDGDSVQLLGIIEKIQKKVTKQNQTMCFLTLEDITSSIECLIFPKLYSERVQLLNVGNVVVINGRVSLREDKEPTVLVGTISIQQKPSAAAVEKKKVSSKKSGIYLKFTSRADERISSLKKLSEFLCGNFPVYAFYEDEKAYELFSTVYKSDVLIEEYKRILSEENVAVR